MSLLFEELEQKFNNFENKKNARIAFVNNVYENQKILLNEQFDTENLLEKYSSQLNISREGLLAQISNNLVKEINFANEIGEKLKTDKTKNLSDEFREIKKLNFKCSVLKSSRICVWKIIMQEFKFTKKFSSPNLKKYKHVLGLSSDSFCSNDRAVFKAIILASFNDNVKIIEYLVENGMLIQKEVYFNTELLFAYTNGFFNFVKYLL